MRLKVSSSERKEIYSRRTVSIVDVKIEVTSNDQLGRRSDKILEKRGKFRKKYIIKIRRRRSVDSENDKGRSRTSELYTESLERRERW